jgi:hypothetical protein
MADLREFLSELATDPQRLGQFILDPEAAMTEAELSEEDKQALRSGFPAIIYARLAGLSTERAFQIDLPRPGGQQPLQFPQFPPLQFPQQFPQFPPLQFPQQFPQFPPLQFPQQFPQFPPPQIWRLG